MATIHGSNGIANTKANVIFLILLGNKCSTGTGQNFTGDTFALIVTFGSLTFFNGSSILRMEYF